MRLPRLVGIWSPTPRSGKTAIAEHFVNEFNFVRIPFAQPLKRMVRILLAEYGYGIGELDEMESGDKNIKPFEFSEATLRKIYQTLGTEWGRMCIDPDLWVNIWKQHTKRTLELYPNQGVVVDDVRFPNEIEAVRALDGQMIKVVRPGIPRMIGHASEALNENAYHFEHVIVNDTTINDLCRSINQEFDVCMP